MAAHNETEGPAPQAAGKLGRWLETASFAALVGMAAAAPHSIAVSQSFWLLGLVALAARMIVGPRPRFRITAIDAALLGFVAWSVLSAFTSYEPAISLDKLRSVGLFTVFYFARGSLNTPRSASIVVFVLILSAMVTVIWTPLERLIGRGVEVHGVRPDGTLSRYGMKDGDTILTVGGMHVRSSEEVIAAIAIIRSGEVAYHRPDADQRFRISESDLSSSGSPEERLGIESWKPNRVWRAKGFYGHFTTFSEMLQLVGSLLLGLGLAWLAARKARRERSVPPYLIPTAYFGAFALLCVALILSGTRASQLGLFVSGVAMVAALGSRRILIAILIAAIPVAAAGYFALQHTRQQNESNEYRITMWRDGVRLATESPRHSLVGVGMDSIKERWKEWGLFGGGRLPMGHFHSTPLQLAVERGFPALLLWLAFLALIGSRFWRSIRSADPALRVRRGVLAGCLGAACGFFVAGLVHYNLGDGEVALIFYMLMGIGFSLSQRTFLPNTS